MNSKPTTPDERALLAREVHAHLTEDRRVQMGEADLERLAVGLPNTFSADDTVDALARWVAPVGGDLPWTTTRSGFDAVVAARARRDEARRNVDIYDPTSRVVTGIVVPSYGVSRDRDGGTVAHVGDVDVTSYSVGSVPVHWSHTTGVRCGELVGIERRSEGLKVWLELKPGELEDRALALVDLGRVGLSAGLMVVTTPESPMHRRVDRMRLREVSLTMTPAFGVADTLVKRVADVPRLAAEALRRERSDEVDVRALEAGATPSGRAAGGNQVRTFPGARIHLR